MCQDYLSPELANICINLTWLIKGNRKLCMLIQTSKSFFHLLFLNQHFNGEIFFFNRSIVLVEKLEQKFGSISLS